MHRAIPSILAGAWLVFMVGPGGVSLAEETTVAASMEDAMVDTLFDWPAKTDGPMEVRFNGGGPRQVPSQEGLDRVLASAPWGEQPLASPEFALSTTGTPNVCRPAIIVTVIALGGFAVDMDVAGEPVGSAVCHGLPLVGPVATGSVDASDPQGTIILACAITNSEPGWIPEGNTQNGWNCWSWHHAQLFTTNCAVLVEAVYENEYWQQLSMGMPGCVGPIPSAAATVW